MNFDIRTLLVANSVIVGFNALILIQTWLNARSMRIIIGYWSFAQVLFSIGMILITFRDVIPDFLSIIIANACLIGGQIANQEGIARYMNKDGYLRTATWIALFMQVVLFLVFTYVIPAVASRIITYSLVAILLSSITISTLRKGDTKIDAPRKFLIGVLVFHICLMLSRLLVAILQGGYTGYMNSGQMQAFSLLGILCCYSGSLLCLLSLISHRLGLEVQQQAFTDSLTEVPNRRAMDEFLDNLMPVKVNCNIALLLIDVDKFKEINDQFGHQAGDLYLIHLCRIITDELRQGDAIFRYAGDEFVVVVRDVDQLGAKQMAERFKHKLEQLSISWNDQQFSTTVSIGLALADTQIRNGYDLIKIADEALYSAKRLGGNRVAVEFN